jgi:hypothetical protein
MIEYNSNKKCCSCCTIVVKDTYKTNRLHGNIQFNIKQYVSNSNTNSLYGPLLKLFKGMKVILIENLYKKPELLNNFNNGPYKYQLFVRSIIEIIGRHKWDNGNSS